METDQLDLRRIPVWERPDKVFAACDTLPLGGSLTLVTDIEPRGLATRIEQERKHQLIIDPRRIGNSEWVIRITRSDVEPEAPAALSVLKRSPVFSSLDEPALERLAHSATVHTARRGQILVAEGTDWPHVGLVSEGVLAVSSGNGHTRQRIFYEVFPNEVFGAAEFFDSAPAGARVNALSKVARYVRIPREVALDVAKQDSRLVLSIGRVVAQRKRDLMQSLATQSTMPIIARIAQVLLPFAINERGLAPASAPLPNMTQAQIAAAAGTVKEVAARAIAELESRGLLKRERGHIKYLDRTRLADLIKEGE